MPYDTRYNDSIARQYNAANERYVKHLINTHQSSRQLSGAIATPEREKYKDGPDSYFDEDHRLQGSGFFDDLGDGLDKIGNVVGKVSDIAQKVAPLAELAAGSKKPAKKTAAKKPAAKKAPAKKKGSKEFLSGEGFLDDVLGTVGQVADVAQKVAPLAMLAAGKKRGRPSKMKGGVGMGVSANKELDKVQEQLALGSGKLVERSQMKGVVVGSGKRKVSKWQELVSETSKKRGKGMKDAIQYIKANNLYKK